MKIMNNKELNDYKLYVFDLDGTLYNQPRLRFIMATRLMKYYALHPFRSCELLWIQDFRKTKDSWKDDSCEDNIIADVAARHKKDTDVVKAVIKKWIYENPLSALAATKYDKVIGLIEKLRRDGKPVVILSDYPTEDKLKALGVICDASYSTTDERIGELKPSPKGLLVVMEDFKAEPSETLMVGDRDEKDGKSAAAAGCDYLNVKEIVC